MEGYEEPRGEDREGALRSHGKDLEIGGMSIAFTSSEYYAIIVLYLPMIVCDMVLFFVPFAILLIERLVFFNWIFGIRFTFFERLWSLLTFRIYSVDWSIKQQIIVSPCDCWRKSEFS